MEENSVSFLELWTEIAELERKYLEPEKVKEEYEKGKQEALKLIDDLNKRISEISEKAESGIYILSFADTWLGSIINSFGSDFEDQEKMNITEAYIKQMLS